MTAENSPRILYLNEEVLRILHNSLSAFVKNKGEPIPPYELARAYDIDALLMLPQQSVYGQELYPTLAEKAAILFYSINKKQVFKNGNKRMSTLCLAVFLGVNDKKLDVTSDELRDKALWLAQTASLDFPVIKEGLVAWINAHLVDISGNPDEVIYRH
jgi:death-on-curing protein